MIYGYANRPVSKPEKISQKSKTEQYGYVSTRQQVERMMAAGVTLADFRKQLYDWDDEKDVDESLSDPTRSKSFDLADATTSYQEVKGRFLERAKSRSAKKIKDAELVAQSDSNEPTESKDKPSGGKA